jgi:hypothetical protein
MSSFKKSNLERDFVAALYLSEAPSSGFLSWPSSNFICSDSGYEAGSKLPTWLNVRNKIGHLQSINYVYRTGENASTYFDQLLLIKIFVTLCYIYEEMKFVRVLYIIDKYKWPLKILQLCFIL